MKPVSPAMLRRLGYITREADRGWPVLNWNTPTVQALEIRGLVKQRRTITILSDGIGVVADAIPCIAVLPTDRGRELLATGEVMEQGG